MVKPALGAIAVVLAAMPLVGVAKTDRASKNSVTRTFSYSLQVVSDCSLTLRTRTSVAATDCEADGARLNVYDRSRSGTTVYTVQNGRHAAFEVCSGAGEETCYRNSSDPALGISIGNGEQATNLHGRPPAGTAGFPGSFTDTITIALSFD